MKVEKPIISSRAIPAVTVESLDRQTKEGKLDPGAEALLQVERNYICARREEFRAEEEQNISEDGIPQNLVGLALSGGGIRSAIFSLGVMQALSQKGILNKVDYLSTVSGGGYIGAALTWLGSGQSDSKEQPGQDQNAEFSSRREQFPFGTENPAPGSEQWDSADQRDMLKYLRQHGNYLSPGAGISVISLLAVVMRGTLLNLMVWLPLFGMVFYCVAKIAEKFFPSIKPFPSMICAGLGIFGGLILLVICYSIATWLRRGFSLSGKNWYRLRRCIEKGVAFLIPCGGILLIFGTLPNVYELVQSKISAAGTGSAAILSGAGIAMKSFLDSGTSKKSMPSGIMAPLSSALFLYGVLLVSFYLSSQIYPKQEDYLVIITLFSLVLGVMVNLNYISIHRYYRDRLMETFMPDIQDALSNKTKAAVGADKARLSSFSFDPDSSSARSPGTPYHIVNTNIVLVNSKVAKYRDRGGDNFILSPEYCGSNATGWCSTEEFMGGKMTLATAVAVSGAAANPNTGVGGAGLTRNKFLSLVMSLLNLKLGYWASNTGEQRTKIDPNHFFPGCYSFGNALGIRGFREDKKFVQLSDGGHFENMAVYELVRRRARLIFVCDGGADPIASFSDFQTTVRRVEDDFGAKIKVDDDLGPDNIVPVNKSGAEYPKEREFAKLGFMKGEVTYSDGSKGTIIYLKTTLIKDVSFKVKGYAAANPDFPDQSTADQFFDEVQFEAYRELGYAIACQMMDHPAVDIDAILA